MPRLWPRFPCPVRDSGHADQPVWRCRAGSVNLIGSGRLLGYAADFARGCVFRLNGNWSSTRRGFRYSSLIVDATDLPRPRARPIASLRRQLSIRAMPVADLALVVSRRGVVEDAVDALARSVRAVETQKRLGIGGPMPTTFLCRHFAPSPWFRSLASRICRHSTDAIRHPQCHRGIMQPLPFRCPDGITASAGTRERRHRACRRLWERPSAVSGRSRVS